MTFDQHVNKVIREKGTFSHTRTDSDGITSDYLIEKHGRSDYRGWWADDHSVETQGATPTECWLDGER